MATQVSEVEQRVVEILKAAGYPFVQEEGRCRVERGSTAVFVSAHAWQDRYTIIELVCPVLNGVDVSEALLKRLNELNEKLYFGKAYWRNKEVWIAHNLLGDHLDSDELIACVGMMAVVADHLDDELKARFGGQRWREAKP
jgi:hypothetical protein